MSPHISRVSVTRSRSHCGLDFKCNSVTEHFLGTLLLEIIFTQ